MCRKLCAALQLLLLMLVSGCANTSASAGRIEAARAELPPLLHEHAEALLADGGDRSVVTGVKLIAAVEAVIDEEN